MAIFSGEMTGGQQDRQGSLFFILGVLAMAGSFHCVLLQRSICHSALMPKRELEGGPGREKSILPNEASSISPPNSWHSSLLNHIKRDTATLPTPHNPTAMPSSMGSISSPRTPVPLLSSTVFSQKATLPAQTCSPWVVVAQSLLLALPLFLGTSPSTLFTLRWEQS